MISQHRLEEAFPGKGLELRQLLTQKRTTTGYQTVKDWVASSLNRPPYIERLMMALNEILEGHGVEAVIRSGNPPDAEYVNMGDTYATTLIWDCKTKSFRLQSLGDWIEAAERRGVKYD